MSQSKVKQLRKENKPPEPTLEEKFIKAVQDKLYHADDNGETGLDVKLRSAKNITQLISVRTTFIEYFGGRLPTEEEANYWADYVVEVYERIIAIVKGLTLEGLLVEDSEWENPIAASLHNARKTDEDILKELLGFLNMQESVLWLERFRCLCRQDKAKEGAKNEAV
jgi:hypothetical protein